jgi:hypothetical protein
VYGFILKCIDAVQYNGTTVKQGSQAELVGLEAADTAHPAGHVHSLGLSLFQPYVRLQKRKIKYLVNK